MLSNHCRPPKCISRAQRVRKPVLPGDGVGAFVKMRELVHLECGGKGGTTVDTALDGATGGVWPTGIALASPRHSSSNPKRCRHPSGVGHRTPNTRASAEHGDRVFPPIRMISAGRPMEGDRVRGFEYPRLVGVLVTTRAPWGEREPGKCAARRHFPFHKSEIVNHQSSW